MDEENTIIGRFLLELIMNINKFTGFLMIAFLIGCITVLFGYDVSAGSSLTTVASESSPTPQPIMLGGSDLRPMVYVPGGVFKMGASDDDTNADRDEKPQHEVTLDAFWIDQYEVTHTEYAACVQASVCDAPGEEDYNGFSYAYAAEIDNAPVVNVNWDDANAYCEWVGKRLPTEAEWEHAARGEDDRIYPWGNDTDASGKAWYCANCIYDYANPDVLDDFSRPMSVTQFEDGASPYGVHGMAGNVWEWVWDWYADDTYSQLDRVNPVGPEDGTYRVVRGGSWTSPIEDLRSTYRAARGPLTAWIDVGFRCAMDDDPSKLIQEEGVNNVPTPSATAVPELFAYTPADDGSGYAINIYSIGLSPDGNSLAIGANNGMITLWDVHREKVILKPWVHSGIVEVISWSPDGNLFASSGGDDDNGYNVIIWNAQGYRQFSLEGHTKTITHLVWSPDGSTLASGGYDGNLFFWDPENGGSLPILEEGLDVEDFQWSPDGSVFAASVDNESSVVLWDTNDWERITVIPSDSERPVTLGWSLDGTLLAYRVYNNDDDDYNLFIWDVEAEKQLFEVSGGYLWKWGQGNALITVNDNGKAPTLFTTDGEIIEFESAPERILEFDWSPDGRIINAGTGKKMVFWDAKTGDVVDSIDALTLRHRDFSQWVANGDLLIVNSDGVIFLTFYQEH